MKINSRFTLRKKKDTPSSLNLLETNHAWTEKFEFTEEEKQNIAAITQIFFNLYRTR